MLHIVRCCFVLLVVSASTIPAAVVTVDTSFGAGQLGGFYGPPLPGDAPPVGYMIGTPDNAPTFQNYFLGRTTVSGFTTTERRTFFIFDLSGVAGSIPVGEIVTGVSIDLTLVAPIGSSVMTNFATTDVMGDPFELVEFSSTPFSADAIKDPGLAGVDPIDIWDSFGTATDYGDFLIPGGVPGPMDGTETIPLPGALADVDTALSSPDGIFIVTARLETYDPGTLAADPFEFVFGLSDVVAAGSTIPAPILTITTAPVPEPSALALVGMCIGALARRRRL